jgi:hypothetical protein
MIGPVRARDLRASIKELGYDKGVVATLEAVLEERVQEREQMRELVQLVSQCIDQVEKMISVGTGMHSRLDAIKRTGEQDE